MVELTENGDKQLISAAERAYSELDLPKARSLAMSACTAYPESAAAYVLHGRIAADLGDIDAARASFQNAYHHNPNSWLACLWLGQLSEFGGPDALDWFAKGASVLEKIITQTQSSSTPTSSSHDLQDIASKLSGSYCSMAELYMLDLCDEVDAEQKCQALVDKAQNVAKQFNTLTLPEPLQILASLRLSQDRPDDAAVALKKSLTLWREDSPLRPPYPMRISLSRLLIESGLLEDAILVLDELRAEDDSVVDLWYLLGWTWHLREQQLKEESTGADEEDDSESASEQSKECLLVCLQLYKQLEWDDEGIKCHAQELLAQK